LNRPPKQLKQRAVRPLAVEGDARDIDKMSTKQSSRWSIDTRIFVNCGIDGVGIDRVKIDD
jgi:hypothetical protein